MCEHSQVRWDKEAGSSKCTESLNHTSAATFHRPGSKSVVGLFMQMSSSMLKVKNTTAWTWKRLNGEPHDRKSHCQHHILYAQEKYAKIITDLPTLTTCKSPNSMKIISFLWHCTLSFFHCCYRKMIQSGELRHRLCLCWCNLGYMRVFKENYAHVYSKNSIKQSNNLLINYGLFLITLHNGKTEGRKLGFPSFLRLWQFGKKI